MSCVHRTKDGVCRKCSAGKYVAYCPDGPCQEKIVTNGDRIRAMTDEELVEKIFALNWDGFPCENKPECDDLLDTEDGIPEENCRACLLRWLQRPAEETP